MDKIRQYFYNAQAKNTKKGFYIMCVLIAISCGMIGWIFYDMSTR